MPINIEYSLMQLTIQLYILKFIFDIRIYIRLTMRLNDYKKFLLNKSSSGEVWMLVLLIKWRMIVIDINRYEAKDSLFLTTNLVRANRF
jgi:hypothetical protein